MFSDISVVGISGFIYLYSNRRDKISYFSKTVDEDENISIYNIYKGIRQQKTHVVYRNITLSALRNEEGTELSLGSLTRGFCPRVNITVADETIDIPLDIRLLIDAAGKKGPSKRRWSQLPMQSIQSGVWEEPIQRACSYQILLGRSITSYTKDCSITLR